jgi:hypothetical protein
LDRTETFKINGFGLKVEIPDLPESCWLSSKYVICDPNGTDTIDNFSFVVVAGLEASEYRSMQIDVIKVFVNNLLVEIDAWDTELDWHGPMVKVHVDEKVMTEEEFSAWWLTIHPP